MQTQTSADLTDAEYAFQLFDLAPELLIPALGPEYDLDGVFIGDSDVAVQS